MRILNRLLYCLVWLVLGLTILPITVCHGFYWVLTGKSIIEIYLDWFIEFHEIRLNKLL